MPKSKLTAVEARAIAEAIAAGERHVDIARRFGVSVETVGAIRRGTRWASALDDDGCARMRAAPAIGDFGTS